mmetsp:Transcript_18775/g.26014  ORF Transcript_18775/g.26014 Transcript_18775/m.26014 type:complete len:205 (-) Transcript_18775:316-930(-)
MNDMFHPLRAPYSHGKRRYMHPLGGRPFLAPQNRAPCVLGELVQDPVGFQREEKQRVPFLRAHTQASRTTRGKTAGVLGLGPQREHRLSTKLRCIEVQQDRCHPVASIVDPFFVKEVVEVRLVLLPLLVLQHLQALAVFLGDHTPLGYFVLHAFNNLVSATAKKGALTSSNVAFYRSTIFNINNSRSLKSVLRHMNKMITFFFS